MPTKVPTVFDRQGLRELYDAAVIELNTLRGSDLLATDFYLKTEDAVFNAGCLALSDASTDTHRMHTVSAPAGGGKTSFAYALMVALTRYAETRPEAPYGAVFVVDQIERADKVFRELNALLPGKVAVWTTDHDPKCKEPKKVKAPAAQFSHEELRHYPVIVVTHAFYLSAKGHLARGVVRNRIFQKHYRALTVVDERPDEAPELSIKLSEAQSVREQLMQDHPDTKVHLDALLSFMEAYSYAEKNKLYRPGIEIEQGDLNEKLRWFASSEAELLVTAAKAKIPGIVQLFSFAKALVAGRACVATTGDQVYFFGYEERRVIDLTAGTILLDATADVDGVSSIVPWRVASEAPKARYDNLQIIHVHQHTKVRLSEYLKTAANQRAYVRWVVDTIKQNMAPGERGLVICKKCLFDAERIPLWSEGDPRFQQPNIYTEGYGWNLEGRHLCATHWGTGVGSNAWNEANVVFLFDEFFIPRRVAITTTQGLRGHRVHQGDLGAMKTLNSKARGVDLIAEGHALRWTKQLALRGKARVYDENGVCGKQRLVVGSDLKRFMLSAPKLFPGAKITTQGGPSDGATMATIVLELLSKTTQHTLTSDAIGQRIGKRWRTVSSKILTDSFLQAAAALGWRYVSRKGRGGSRFERIEPEVPQGFIGAPWVLQGGALSGM